MKIQLDTSSKTIKIEENVKISKLIEVLKRLLPNEWKDFTLETHTNINYWREPIIIREYPHRPYWENPWYYQEKIGYGNKTTASCQLKEGTYNI